MSTCNQACIIVLPVIIAILGTSLVFVSTYTIYLRRQHATCTAVSVRDPEKGHPFAHGKHPIISGPIPIPGSSPEVRGLVPIIRSPSTTNQHSISMPAIRYSSTPEISPKMECPSLSMPDRIRVAIGLEPRCPCRRCRDNPRVAPSRRTHHQSASYATPRGLEITISPQRSISTSRSVTRKSKEDILPIFMHHNENEANFSPKSSKHVSKTDSQYSQMAIPTRLPSRFSEPQFQPPPLQPLHPSPPLSLPTPQPVHMPLSIRRMNPNLHISLMKSSHASLRSPGLPASPRPSHRPTVSESLVPRLPRDLVSVGLTVDHQDVIRDVLEGGLALELEGLQILERGRERGGDSLHESRSQGTLVKREIPERKSTF